MMDLPEKKKELLTGMEPLPNTESPGANPGMDPAVADYLKNKYFPEATGLAKEKEAAIKEFEDTNPTMGVGGELLTGLRAALRSDTSYDALKKAATEQRARERAEKLAPFDEREKALESKFKAGKGAIEGSKAVSEEKIAGFSLKDAENDHDVNSPDAPMLRTLLAKSMKKDPSDPLFAKMSPAQIMKALGGAEKLRAIESSEEYKKLLAEDRADRARTRAETAKATQVDKWRKALKDDLDPNKARGGALAQTQMRLNRAKILQTLMNDPAQAGNLDRRQIEEAAIGLNALLSGSNTGAQEQVKQLVPQSWQGSAAKILEWLTNEPKGTNQQKFVKRMLGTITRERNVAEDMVKEAQVQRLAAHKALKEADEDSYHEILGGYGIDPVADVDEKGRYKYRYIDKDMPKAGAAAADPNDPEYQEWLALKAEKDKLKGARGFETNERGPDGLLKMKDGGVW